MSVRLDPGASMTDAIESVREAGGWQKVMRALGQDPDTLFRELVASLFHVEGSTPTMFEFWMVGYLGGLVAQATMETEE